MAAIAAAAAGPDCPGRAPPTEMFENLSTSLVDEACGVGEGDGLGVDEAEWEAQECC